MWKPHAYSKWPRGSCKVWVGGWRRQGWRREHSCGLNAPSERCLSLLPQQEKTAEGHHGRTCFCRLEGKSLEIRWKSVHSNQHLWNPHTWHSHQSEGRCTHALMLLLSHTPNPWNLQFALGARLSFGATCVAAFTWEYRWMNGWV